SFSPSVWNTTSLSMRLKKSGGKRRRTASTAIPRVRLGETSVGAKPKRCVSSFDISAAPMLPVMKIIVFEKSTLRLSPKVNVALVKNPQQKIPERVACLFDLIEKHETQPEILCVEPV